MGVLDRAWYTAPRPRRRRLRWWVYDRRRELAVLAVVIALSVVLSIGLSHAGVP